MIFSCYIIFFKPSPLGRVVHSAERGPLSPLGRVARSAERGPLSLSGKVAAQLTEEVTAFPFGEGGGVADGRGRLS